MKKVMTSLLMTAAISAAMISCKKDKDDAPAPTLSISPSQSAVVFNADGTPSGNTTFTVATNQSAWDAVSSQTWCTVTKTAAGFTVSATANASATAPAPATVTVTAAGATPIVINVTQAGNPLPVAKAALQAAIDAATAAKDALTTFVEGTQYAAGNVFLGETNTIPVGLKAVAAAVQTDYAAAIAAAQTAYNAANATVASIETAITALATATAAFNTALAGATPGTKGLAARISAANSGTTVYLYGDETAAPITLTKAITLEGAGGERTVQLASSGSLFTINTGGSLTLDNNATLRGISPNTSSNGLVYVYQGSFTMKNGSKVTGNASTATSINTAGGVFVYTDAAALFTMEGGTITGNSSLNGGVGGLFVAGKTVISGGTISGNTGKAGNDVVVTSNSAARLTLSGSPAIDRISVLANSVGYYGRIDVGGALTGTGFTLDLCSASPYTIAAAKTYWANISTPQILNKASGYTGDLQTAKFTLGNWVENAATSVVEPVATAYPNAAINATGVLVLVP
ncbi:MAG: hypothetical protein LBR08_03795 [Bacteroidales bacterium]|jgi:hypothetical protein|nr:hypothetical protein [Bacteroidales bacterium]